MLQLINLHNVPSIFFKLVIIIYILEWVYRE